MGLLSVAGALSGAGQALERGLGNTQLGMINMALQEQREQSAAERDTVAYNRQRFNIEDERTYTKQIDAELRGWQDKQLNTKIQADQDLLDKRLKGEAEENAKNRDARMSEHILSEGAATSRQGEELRWKTEREDRSHRFELAKQQADIGRDIVLHSLRVQEARESAGLKGEAKLDPRHKAQIDFQMERLKGLQEQMKGGLLPPEEQQRARAEVDQIGRTIDQILGLRTVEPSAKSGSTVSIVDPFATPATPQSPRATHGRSQSVRPDVATAQAAAAEAASQLPSDNIPDTLGERAAKAIWNETKRQLAKPTTKPTPTLSDIEDFIRFAKDAKFVEAYIERFGAAPSQEDYEKLIAAKRAKPVPPGTSLPPPQ